MSLECYIGPERNLLETTEKHAHRLRMPHPILSNEAAGGAQAHEPPRLADEDDRHHLGRERRPGGLAARDRPHLRRGRSGDRRRLHAGRALRPRRRPRPRAAQLAARDAAPCIIIWCATRSARASASSSKRAKPAKCITTACSSATAPTRSIRTWRSRRCGRRAATACSTGEGIGDESAKGTDDPTTKIDRHALSQGRRQGHAQGDGQDGHLDAAELQGRADLRSRRPQRRSDRPLLRRHRQPHSRRRLRRARRGSAAPARARLSRARGRSRCRCCRTRASSTGGPKASGTCGTRRRSPTCKSPPATTAPTPTSGSPITRTTTRAPAAQLRGLLKFKRGVERRADSARRSRAGQDIVKRFCTGAMSFGSISAEAHETLADRHEPPRRQEQHGRRRRRPRAVQAAAQRRLASARRSSRSPPAASASRSGTSPTPTSCRSRSRKARSPAKGASCPATRSTTTSPASATRRPAWASSARRRITTSTRSRISSS